MDLASLKKEYEADGYVVLRGFLPPGELAALMNQLDRYIREVVPALPDGDAFYQDRSIPESLKQLNRLQHDPFFTEYQESPRWKDVAEGLLGEPVIVQGCEWFNKPPCTQHPTPPHQDNYYFCLKPPQVLTLWLALDDVDEENGCLRYLPGSHLQGVRPHQRTSTLGFSQGISDYSNADRAREIPITAQPGDLLVHHGDTVHRADANRSASRHRRSFGLVFRGVSCQRDEAAYQRYLASSRQQHEEFGLKG